MTAKVKCKVQLQFFRDRLLPELFLLKRYISANPGHAILEKSRQYDEFDVSFSLKVCLQDSVYC